MQQITTNYKITNKSNKLIPNDYLKTTVVCKLYLNLKTFSFIVVVAVTVIASCQ